EAAVAKYLSSVTANSDSNPYVRVSTTKQKDGTTLITLNALAVTPTDPAKPLPEVTLNVNSDLNEDGVSHGISIVLKLCVRAKPTSLKLNHTSYSFCTGDSFELIAMPMPQGDTASHYVFDVLDDSIVSVEEKAATDGNGHFMIKALKMGVTTVMISSTTDSRINAKCVITVGNKPTQITVKDKIITLAVGGSYQLEPMYVDAAGNQFGGTFKFALDAAGQQQSDYLSVDKNGMVTALKLPEDGARKQIMVSSKLWENDLNAIVVYINIIEAASRRIGFKQSDYVIALNESIVIAPVYTPENAKSHLRYTLTRSSATSATAEAVAMTVADDEQSVTLKASNTVRGVYILKVETYSTNPNIVLPKAEGTCTITVGYRATGIAVDKPYLTMGVGEKLSPGYKLLPAGAVSSDVYYSIERILPADLWGDQVGGNAVSYLRPGTAITDDQLDPNDYTKSVSGEYTGSYIQAVSPGVIRVEMRTATSAHNTGVKTQWVIEIKH
ncbi:MAG: hypothetical protein RSC91_03610, partial [Clostridia bacterium]